MHTANKPRGAWWSGLTLALSCAGFVALAKGAHASPQGEGKYKTSSPAAAAARDAPIDPGVEELPIDLPTALRLANASNPTISVARVRIQEAYYRQRQAAVSWLPNLQASTGYNRHDGILQNSTGLVFPTSKWNYFATGGAVMSFQVADALFLPLVARQLTQAEAARARTVTNDIQLQVALTYLDLLDAHGRLAVNAEARAYAEVMLGFAEASREAQMGKTPADVTRARAEVELRREERLDLETGAAEVSARLAQLLLMRPTVDLKPADPTVVPICLVPTDGPLDDLVVTGLMNRPEMAQFRALVAAARARWRQARVAPFMPRLDVGYLSGEFGGGLRDEPMRFGGRSDGAAQATWELHNLGAGDVAVARERRALYSEANLHMTEIQAQVGAEISAAAKAARNRQRALAHSQEAVKQAEETWRRLREAAFGLDGREKRYDPLEPLLAEQQVAEARTRYIREIIEYNKAQFRLYTAMGQPPMEALPKACALPVEVPVLPPAR
jgi:outer membrane protein TolC